MARSTAPEYSRGQIARSGRAIRNGSATMLDHYVVENHRTSHSHILNAFQASLRNRARDKDVTVAQRLKRRATIYDKLTRRPNFSLTEMQDIAGCRLIFKNVDDLHDFRTSYLNARFQHKLLTEDERFNYLRKPKLDGYRGLHDVYEYRAARQSGERWNKLRIELQYRTIYQHAWATAVEVAGLLTENEHKFGRAASDYSEFFCLASEMIARTFEASTSCYSEMSLIDVVNRFHEIDQKIELLNLFRQYNRVAPSVFGVNKNAILIFNKRADQDKRTEMLSFASFADAVRRLGELEQANFQQNDPYDIVLVRSVSGGGSGSIESAFRNYFADTRDFVRYIEQATELGK